ncbi:MAG: hypothetical protein Q4P36_06335 [Bowdeniella nasicola]|nr:hypothetical protein [Bowdeniella nasicola]
MQARTFYLFGHRVGYSASPMMMAAAFADLGLPHRYTIWDVAPADFPDALQELRRRGGGANVTVPHKEVAAQSCDELSDSARALGAVNTIEVRGDRLIGHNTDYPALRAELAELVSAAGSALPASRRRAALLGAGGAAKAASRALGDLGFEVTTLARRLGTWDEAPTALPQCHLLVNATPIGTQSDELPVDHSLLRPDLAVYDLVYRPTPTALVAAARERGASARAGAGMLAGQGRLALEIWLGRPIPAEPMRAALLNDLGASRP